MLRFYFLAGIGIIVAGLIAAVMYERSEVATARAAQQAAETTAATAVANREELERQAADLKARNEALQASNAINAEKIAGVTREISRFRKERLDVVKVECEAHPAPRARELSGRVLGLFNNTADPGGADGQAGTSRSTDATPAGSGAAALGSRDGTGPTPLRPRR